MARLHSQPNLNKVINDPQFDFTVLEKAAPLPDYPGNHFMYDAPTYKTRRGILLALEQAGVAYIPASQRYIVYEHQKPLIALFRDLLHRD